MPDAFWGVPIFFGLFFVLIFVVVIGGIIFATVKGITTWNWNNQQPVQTVIAKLGSKRTATSGGGNDTSVSTSYHVTFETQGEGDSGMLTFQGTRYKGFSRAIS